MDTKNSRNLKSWTVTVQQDGEDLVLPLPQEMLDEVGWKPGDTLEWHDQGDGTWELQRKKQQLANEDS